MISQDRDKKLFLIDAYAMIFRAYYAFIKNPRINSKGLNTSAIFGFTNSLHQILKNEKPTHIAVVFDPPGGTFRNEEFTEYKANRDETPNDIILAVPWIKKIIEAFHIPVISIPGFEADDTIGTLAHKAAKEGFVTYMMTPDKDFGQLVTEDVLMYRPGRGRNPAEVWGPEEVCERYGVRTPLQVIDLLGLMGDSVDNIPGIPGIGAKTASKLLMQYENIEELLENTDDLKGKQKENVINFAEQGLMSKHLATIVLDVPVEFEPDKLILEEKDTEMLKGIFDELEFRNLSKTILGVVEPAPATEEAKKTGNDTVQTSLFEQFEAAAETRTEERKQLDNIDHKYELLSTTEQRAQLIQKLKQSERFAFDTETSDLDPIKARLVGMSFSMKKGEAFYVPTPQGEEKAILNEFLEVFEDPSKTLIAQNLKYDMKVLKNHGVELKTQFFDTMIAHYLMNPDSKHGMDFLSETYLNYSPVPISELIGKKGKNQKSMDDLAPEDIADYASEDADITFQLYEIFKSEMDKDHLKKLFEDLEIPLIEVLADMELNGVKIDTKSLGDYSIELGESLTFLEKNIVEMAGEEFNIDSPKQLGPILFEKLIPNAKARKTKTGQYSTSEDVLRKLVNEHPIIGEILEYRKLKKLKSTYVDPLPTLVNEKTDRVHTSYMQTVAATGRLSSNNPNLQNIPIRTDKGREIRRAFIPSSDEHILFAADYSQVELRIIADLSKDAGMIQAFNENKDIHAATAAKVFGVPLDEVNRDMRSKAKAVNFGIIYGQGAFGLAENLGISRKEAKSIIDSYFEQFEALRNYQKEVVDFARANGYVETVLGRRRYLKDINAANAVVRSFAERNAVNAPVQGSAADIIKKAMIDIHHEMKQRDMKSKMVMQVHDELVFDALKSELDELQTLVVDKMQNAFTLSVPLKVDTDSGVNWLEAH